MQNYYVKNRMKFARAHIFLGGFDNLKIVVAGVTRISILRVIFLLKIRILSILIF